MITSLYQSLCNMETNIADRVALRWYDEKKQGVAEVDVYKRQVSGDPQVCRGEATPSCLRKTALWLKSPTGAFIAAQTPIPPFHSLFQKEAAAWFALRPPARHSV